MADASRAKAPAAKASAAKAPAAKVPAVKASAAKAPLDTYRRKRNAAVTPEPVPAANSPLPSGPRPAAGSPPGADSPIFVVQEHHASSLHWDFRLERDGVLVSWALPKGVPDDPAQNHLAVHVEDHPLKYAEFDGSIPAGEYGGGTVTIFDTGTYEVQTWTAREVKVVLTGERVRGRFALFKTGGKNWMIHRMDAPVRPDWQPLPATLVPMLATAGALPAVKDDAGWSYEMKWDGVRALVFIEGGRVRLLSRNGNDVTVSYPEFRALGESLGATQVLLDAEIVAIDHHGRPSFGLLQQRMHVSSGAEAKRLAGLTPAVLLIFDLLHLRGTSLLDMPYLDRREALESLGLAGPSWHVPPVFHGAGAIALQVSQEQKLEGVLAKRSASVYRPGRRSPDWIKIKNIRMQEVVVGGWRPGNGRRASTIGSLLLGVPGPDGLEFCGHVGTGFSDAVLTDLRQRLSREVRDSSPFLGDLPRADSKDAHWVTPTLVGEVAFAEWTSDGRLRHPSWRGLRPDKTPEEVVRES